MKRQFMVQKLVINSLTNDAEEFELVRLMCTWSLNNFQPSLRLALPVSDVISTKLKTCLCKLKRIRVASRGILDTFPVGLSTSFPIRAWKRGCASLFCELTMVH